MELACKTDKQIPFRGALKVYHKKISLGSKYASLEAQPYLAMPTTFTASWYISVVILAQPFFYYMTTIR